MLSKKIGIDLGTATVVVHVKGEGIVLNEPSGLATDARLRHVIARVCGRQRLFRPDVMLSIPALGTGVERRLVLEATMQAGAKSAYLIEKPLAAALGAGLPVALTPGLVICNLGAGSAEAAVIALGEMVATDVRPLGGRQLDAAIAAAVERLYGMSLQEGMAERLKVTLGGARQPAEERVMEMEGRAISAREVYDAIAPLLGELAAMLRALILASPPSVRAAVDRNGVTLTGGGAKLGELAPTLAETLGVPVRVARDPQACVAVGTGMALENLGIMRRGQPYMS